MGGNWRPRNPRAQDDDFERPPPQPRIQPRNPSAGIPRFPQSGPPSPSFESNTHIGADNSFLRRRQYPQQSRSNQRRPQSSKPSHPFPPIPQNHYVSLQKSHRLKQHLVRALTTALSQIEQWYPDDSSDGDMMDWQPEDQIVIPQPDNTIYTYGKGTEQQEVSGDAREGVREGKFGPNPSMRHRAASDVGVQAVQAILQQPSGVVHRDDLLNPSPYRL